MKIPVVELGDCALCDVCSEVAPSVFRINASGYVEIIELASYPEDEIDEAIKNCPRNCISWEQI
ncbi:MAG: ferredoxin [Deltaproteobacteria bacterium]|nr:ferredoxin [Deltaproteobacteria bacterium]